MGPLRLRLKEVRESTGMSQMELSRRAGVAQSTISSLETRDAQSVDLPVLSRLADALGIDATLLFTTAEPPKPRSGRKQKS